jgi:hypothetical protein
LNYGTLAFTTDALTLTNLTLVQQGVIKGADRTENIIGSMLVQPNAVLTHLRGNTNGLRIRVAGLLEVQSGAAMDVSGKGYRGGFRDGNTSGTAEPNSAGTFSTGRSGGSYGTLGTSDNGSANPLYGVESAPVELGSGGASTSGSYLGGNGGGRIDIEAGALRLDGRLVANGGDSSGYAGAGSGGAIFIRIAGGAFFGQGFIGAAGGASYFPGGGGRIAMVGFSLNSFTGTLGGQGTLYLHAGGSLPQITQQPAGQTAISGETVVFSVEARGDGPLSYQWRKNAGDLAAQTNATLTLTNVQIADAGDYAVLVSNAAGAVLSASARLEVNPPNLRAALWEHTSSGDFKIHFEGTPGRRWVIECSSDLKRWGPLWTNTPAAALWEFTDTATSPEPARFYRAVLQP